MAKKPKKVIEVVEPVEVGEVNLDDLVSAPDPTGPVEEAPQPADSHELTIEQVLGQYVDPTNKQAVDVFGQQVIINTTQVPRWAIDSIKNELADTGYEVVCVGHPANHKV